jgi:hypothetical protein
MQSEPAVDYGGFNRPGIFIGAAASGQELRIDLAHRRTALVGFDGIRQLKQFPLGCLGRGKGIFLEFHLPFSLCAIRELHVARKRIEVP